ncbi:nucleoside phosphorylase domain-containing protein [Syncephalis plumigaleata]|nr:nucleoside phosphorylase domain-containing protein [Syncephalis plumigaleata]
MPSDMKNANFPMDAEGHTYHVGLKRGEVCNRILTVGDPERARRLATLLDQDAPLFERESHRGFLTITGRFMGQPVSIIAIGMGMAMMDFMLREVRAVVDGPLCVIRIGTCGAIASVADAGDIIVPDGTTGQQVGREHVISGVNVTADTFYAAQGRVDPSFVDRNDQHVEQIFERYPDAVSLEMENFMLFHLACCATPLAPNVPSIRAAAAMVAVFQRQTNASLPKAELAKLELQAGSAVLKVLSGTLNNEQLHPELESVWLKQTVIVTE